MNSTDQRSTVSVHARAPEPVAHEDVEEGIHRMMDEGGGVVSQCEPEGAPILRSDLVDTEAYTS